MTTQETDRNTAWKKVFVIWPVRDIDRNILFFSHAEQRENGSGRFEFRKIREPEDDWLHVW